MVPKFLGVASALGFLFGSFHQASAAPPFGQVIYSCTVPGVIALAFDDGPWIYATSILDRMEAAGVKATWFINGDNYDYIYNYNATLRRMVSLGHQIGSHTWGHKDLATLNTAQITSQMTQLEDALKNIFGYFPYYMRPPYLSYNQQALNVLGDLKYHVIYGDLNTRDWAYQSETEINNAKQLFTDGLNQGGSIVEAHDPEFWTQGVLIDFMIATIKTRGLTTVTVGECMGQPNSADWYRTSRQSVSSSSSSASSSTRSSSSSSSVPASSTSSSRPASSSSSSSAPGSSQTPSSSTLSTSTLPPSSTRSSSALPSASGIVTTDGTCGITGAGAGKGYICKTGQCCSKWGNCGTTSDYCAASVCQTAFGKCDSDPAPGSVTLDGTCGNIGKGANRGWVCKTGECCSKYGNCGTTVDYCGVSNGCQAAFGKCAS